MKTTYERKAWYLDEDILIPGYVDKRGFHPNPEIHCGFDIQKFNKKMIGKRIFFDLETAKIILKNIKIAS